MRARSCRTDGQLDGAVTLLWHFVVAIFVHMLMVSIDISEVLEQNLRPVVLNDWDFADPNSPHAHPIQRRRL